MLNYCFKLSTTLNRLSYLLMPFCLKVSIGIRLEIVVNISIEIVETTREFCHKTKIKLIHRMKCCGGFTNVKVFKKKTFCDGILRHVCLIKVL